MPLKNKALSTCEKSIWNNSSFSERDIGHKEQSKGTTQLKKLHVDQYIEKKKLFRLILPKQSKSSENTDS